MLYEWLKWLFPGGWGRKFMLGLVVVGGAVPWLTPDQLFELAKMVVIFYFAANISLHRDDEEWRKHRDGTH